MRSPLTAGKEDRQPDNPGDKPHRQQRPGTTVLDRREASGLLTPTARQAARREETEIPTRHGPERRRNQASPDGTTPRPSLLQSRHASPRSQGGTGPQRSSMKSMKARSLAGGRRLLG